MKKVDLEMKQCEALRKDGKTCKNNKYQNTKFCYIHNLKGKSSLTWYKNPKLHFFLIAIGLLATFYYGISGATKENQEKLFVNQEEIRLNIIGQNLKSLPGRDFIILALIRENSCSDLDKYIFDFGRTTTPNNSRAYAYINYENNLVFELIDTEGKIHSVTVQDISQNFEFNRKYLWFFEYGSGKYESYLRVFANGKLIGEKTVNYEIDLGTLKEDNEYTLGASLQGYFTGYFDCWFHAITKISFDAVQKRKMLNIIYADTLKSLFDVKAPEWAKFDGSFYHFGGIGVGKLEIRKTKKH